MQVLLFGGPNNRKAYKSLIVAEYCGVKVEHVSAVGKNPVLETPDGLIFESYSMARYIAKFKGEDTLWGSSVYEYAQDEEWMGFAAAEMDQVLNKWIYPRKRLGSCDPHHCVEIRIAGVRNSLCALNSHLATNRNYLVGDGITLADIAVVCALHFGFTRVMTESFTAEFPHVERYFWNLVGQPNFKKFLGEVKQAESLPVWSEEPALLDKIFLDPEEIPARKKFYVDPELCETWKKKRLNQMIDAHKKPTFQEGAVA
ncbi:hypothetical protein LUZ60_008307 [Juncus effusus]|nr:hypothetical protein LUZ60_008307 [Juncus effusus]